MSSLECYCIFTRGEERGLIGWVNGSQLGCDAFISWVWTWPGDLRWRMTTAKTFEWREVWGVGGMADVEPQRGDR